MCVCCASQVWSLKLEQEVEKNKALCEALQTLGTEHHQLEQSVCPSRKSPTFTIRTDDDFYDALSGQRTNKLSKYTSGRKV